MTLLAYGYYFYRKKLKINFNIRGSKNQLKIQISHYNIADKKISNLLITNSKNNITKNQDIVALRYIIIYHFTKFEVSI